MIARNISKEFGGGTQDDIDAEGDSTGRIPAVVGGASTGTGGDSGFDGGVVSDSGAGASATALDAAESNLVISMSGISHST